MKTFNSVLSLTLAGLLAGYGLTSASYADEQQVTSTPIVRFAQKMDQVQQPGGKQCSVAVGAPGSGHHIKKMSDAGCGNDVVTFFKLENVASSTHIALSSENSCSGGDWLFTVRAIKNPTTSIWLDIRELKNMNEGDIVAPGVAIHGIRYSSGNIEGKLSCVNFYPPDL